MVQDHTLLSSKGGNFQDLPTTNYGSLKLALKVKRDIHHAFYPSEKGKTQGIRLVTSAGDEGTARSNKESAKYDAW